MDISSILNHKTDDSRHHMSSNNGKNNAEESASSDLGQSSPTRCTADQMSPPSSPESTIYPSGQVTGSIKLDTRTSSVSSLQSATSCSPTDSHVTPSERKFQKYGERDDGSSTASSYQLVSCPTTSSSISCSSLSSSNSPPPSSEYYPAIPKLQSHSSSPTSYDQRQYHYQNLPTLATNHAPSYTSTVGYQYHVGTVPELSFPPSQKRQIHQQSATVGPLHSVVAPGTSNTTSSQQYFGARQTLDLNPVPSLAPARICPPPSYSNHHSYMPMITGGPGPTVLRPLAPSGKDKNKHFPCTACYKRFARKSDLMRHGKYTRSHLCLFIFDSPIVVT